jgi:putative transposase
MFIVRAAADATSSDVCTTPSYPPQSNGVAEAFVKTFERDYVYLNELHSAAHVLAQSAGLVRRLHRGSSPQGLGMRSPLEYR